MNHLQQQEQDQEPIGLPKEQYLYNNEEYSCWEEVLADCIDQIPFQEKIAYVNALTKCPFEVRNREANPLLFVEVEQYNMYDAARRLVKYWEWRVIIFGEVLAYKSILNLENMDDDVVFCKMVEDQALVVLPQTDLDGNYVILLDKKRFHSGWDNEMHDIRMLRLTMYTFTELMRQISAERYSHNLSYPCTEYPSNITGNQEPSRNVNTKATFAFVSVLYSVPKNHKTSAANVHAIIRDALPVRLVRTHLLFLPQEWVSRVIQDIATSVYSVLYHYFRHMALIIPHVSVHKPDIVEHLLQYGITPAMMPPSVGGSWHYPTVAELKTKLALTNDMSCYQKQREQEQNDCPKKDQPSEVNRFDQHVPNTNLCQQQLPLVQQQLHDPWDSIWDDLSVDSTLQEILEDDTNEFYCRDPYAIPCTSHRPVPLVAQTTEVLNKSNVSAVTAFVDQEPGATLDNGNVQYISHTTLGQQEQPEVQHQFHDTPAKSMWSDLLDEAIEQIPLREKVGYLGAVTHCPLEIRNEEANPACFVDHEGGNIWAAAKRLATYWEWRLLLFGEPIAYRSILRNLSTVDYVTSNVNPLGWNEFCTLVEDQAFVVLPQVDLDGNFVIFYDGSRLPPGCDRDSYDVLRLALYSLTKLMSRIGSTRPHCTDAEGSTEENKVESFVVVFVAQLNQQSSNSLNKDICDLLLDAVPASFVRIHILYVSDDTSCHTLVRKSLANAVKGTTTLLRQSVLVIPHIGSQTDIVQQLIPYGFTRDMIPQSIGGTWEYGTNSDTFHEQHAIETIGFFESGVRQRLTIPAEASVFHEIPIQLQGPGSSSALPSTTMSTVATRTPIAGTPATGTVTADTTVVLPLLTAMHKMITPLQLHQLVPNLGTNPVNYVKHQHAIADYWRQKIVPRENKSTDATTTVTSNKRRKKDN